MLVEVEVNRDIATSFGTIPAGEKRHAAPSGDGRWLLYLWLPQGGRKGRAVLAPPQWVVRGHQRLETVQQQEAAHADYRHARFTLGWSHDETIEWLAEGYEKSLKTLRQWGFDTRSLENLERHRRRQAAS